MKKKTVVLLILSALFAFKSPAQTLNERVQALKKQLSLEEKIDLLCANAPAIPRLGIPAYDWWSEGLHGVARAGKATVFPKPIGLGSLWDTALVKRIATAVSDEARAKYHKVLREKGYSPRYEGLTYFSPTLNIARDPRWGRTSECFSEDPLLTGETGVAFIQGLQGDDPNYLKLVATPKHFVANNEENRRADGSADVDELSLREYFFPAFRASIEKAKATSVMSAYNALNGIPCSANSCLLNDILRGEWGFDGVVMSDGSAVAKIFTHHQYANTYEEGAAMALKAGCDMSLRDEYRDGLRYAFRRGLVSSDDIDRAVERVLTLRFRLGMFDEPGKAPYSNIPYSVVECEAHRQLALEAAQKSVILLKNDHILPLNTKKTKKIALIGEAFKRVYYGDYSGKPEFNTTVFEALKTAVGNDVELIWVSDAEKNETIASSYLIRPEEYAYEGLMGLTGEYFNMNIAGEALVSKQEAMLDFIPAHDPALDKIPQPAARWTSSLQAPLTGEYTLIYEGDAALVTISLDGQHLIKHAVSAGNPAKVQVNLTAGKKYDIRIESVGINRNIRQRLAWQLPGASNKEMLENVARHADVALIFLREDAAAEGSDRKTLALNSLQEQLIARISKANPNTVLALSSTTPLLLGRISKQVKALLNVWIAGQGEGQALADILLGKVNPSAKTPLTFFSNEKQLPALDDYKVKNGRSYQYFKGDVLYPFGFGLSYTRYEYARPQLKQQRIDRNDSIEVSVRITNKGRFDGEEIVQCYISSKPWETEGLNRKLVAVNRIALKKGTSGTLTFHIPVSELSRWNVEKHSWEIRAGEYTLSVVPHSGERNDVELMVL
ncbi:MAG: glycoside hydrolase family 3 C-terminal domain-containing protein [Dysgonamonadaceae bacterium]|jgi:beta-glucosidase|nr:glycoside hydrolase family 3 C-terminal domain-containing protein [Dysgonamonadaceae bacterium]